MKANEPDKVNQIEKVESLLNLNHQISRDNNFEGQGSEQAIKVQSFVRNSNSQSRQFILNAANSQAQNSRGTKLQEAPGSRSPQISKTELTGEIRHIKNAGDLNQHLKMKSTSEAFEQDFQSLTSGKTPPNMESKKDEELAVSYASAIDDLGQTRDNFNLTPQDNP